MWGREADAHLLVDRSYLVQQLGKLDRAIPARLVDAAEPRRILPLERILCIALGSCRGPLPPAVICI